MPDDASPVRELDRSDALALARTVSQRPDFHALARYLRTRTDGSASPSHVRAFERPDGVVILSFSSSDDRNTLPQAAITAVLDDGEIVELCAERRDSPGAADRMEQIYPSERAPDPEELAGTTADCEVETVDGLTVFTLEFRR